MTSPDGDLRSHPPGPPSSDPGVLGLIQPWYKRWKRALRRARTRAIQRDVSGDKRGHRRPALARARLCPCALGDGARTMTASWPGRGGVFIDATCTTWSTSWLVPCTRPLHHGCAAMLSRRSASPCRRVDGVHRDVMHRHLGPQRSGSSRSRCTGAAAHASDPPDTGPMREGGSSGVPLALHPLTNPLITPALL
jgi:hypothetical protein